jgi:hypothetical protein
VNCGFFVQTVLGDYVGAILGLVRDGISWRLNLVEVSNWKVIVLDKHPDKLPDSPFENSATNYLLKVEEMLFP